MTTSIINIYYILSDTVVAVLTFNFYLLQPECNEVDSNVLYEEQ